MPVREFWSFQPRESHTDLYILDDIANAESWWTDVVTPQSFRRQLFGVNGELHIWFDCYGGDVFAGSTIYDMLREYSKTKGKTVAMISMAASAASLIAMACDEIRISVLGTIMIHEPWANPVGKASVLRASADVLETIRTAQIDAYAKRTGNTTEKILELMQGPDGNGTYMNANMAMELGFADSIIDGENGTDAASLAKSLCDMRIKSAISYAADLVAEAAAKTGPHDPEPDSGIIEARKALMSTCARSY